MSYLFAFSHCLCSSQGKNTEVVKWFAIPILPPMDHVLSEISTMTHASWVALHGMAHSFIELDKAVIYVVSLVSFLCLWFPFCLPSDG